MSTELKKNNTRSCISINKEIKDFDLRLSNKIHRKKENQAVTG
jgi:hypothetical protein